MKLQKGDECFQKDQSVVNSLKICTKILGQRTTKYPGIFKKMSKYLEKLRFSNVSPTLFDWLVYLKDVAARLTRRVSLVRILANSEFFDSWILCFIYVSLTMNETGTLIYEWDILVWPTQSLLITISTMRFSR